MRGSDERSGSLFSYVDLEARVRGDHPLRTIREIANAALSDLSRAFAALYTDFGRPSIAPEKLLRAMLLQAFYGIRSERQLMERMEFDLLFRWFVGLGVDDPVWDHSTFSKNRDRLLEGEIAAKFLAAVLAQPKVKRLLSSDHFSVDGTLIEAWASIKSFRRKDGGDNDARARAATPSAASTRRSAPTRRTRARPTRTHGSTRRATGSRLTNFPFDRIKIDKSFIQGLPKRECAAVIASAVALARGLGITITAEGNRNRISVSELEFHGHRLWAGVSLQSPRTA